MLHRYRWYVALAVLTVAPLSMTAAQATTPAQPQPGQPIIIAPIPGQGIPVGLPSDTATARVQTGTPLVVRGLTAMSTQPLPGTLVCPIIMPGMRLAKGCALIGEKALFLARAPRASCGNGQFYDPQNGGECWTCPAGYTRNASPISDKDACWQPIGETLATATFVRKIGCKAGFFNDPVYGCYQCPAGFNRTLDAVTWSTACSKSIFGPFSFATSGGKPILACANPSFFDPIDGGTCWTCPNSYRRTLNPVNGDKACALTHETKYSFATQKNGCSTAPARVGYGTPFRDGRNGGECWTCPVPLVRSSAPVNATAVGLLAACNAGGNTSRIVWQSPQYPEPGANAFMSGLMKMAFSNMKVVNAFVESRARGDSARKRAIWASMVADPTSSAEVKALLFAALLATARQQYPSPEARISLAAFEKYARGRRVFVAEEAMRMFDAWEQMDGYNAWQAARQSLGSGGFKEISNDVLGGPVPDYKAYAWSAAGPDSAGLEFIVAAAALSGVVPPLVGTTLNNNNANPFEGGEHLDAVFKALDKGLDKVAGVGEKMMTNATSFSKLASGKILSAAGSTGLSIGLTLFTAAIDLGMTTADFIEKEQRKAAYTTIVSEANAPLSVKAMLESSDDDDRRLLLLYWSLATSPHSASAKLSDGRVSGDALCRVDEWTALQCSQAKLVVAAAAKTVGY